MPARGAGNSKSKILNSNPCLPAGRSKSEINQKTVPLPFSLKRGWYQEKSLPASELPEKFSRAGGGINNASQSMGAEIFSGRFASYPLFRNTLPALFPLCLFLDRMLPAKLAVFFQLQLALNRFSVFERIARNSLTFFTRHANKVVLGHS